MKRIFGILIAALAIIHIAGVTPFYIAALQFIKQEVTVELSAASELTTIEVSTTELADAKVFTRLEEGEFLYRGKLYDYKTEEKTAKGYVFYALEDEQEGALQAALCSVYNNNHPGKTQSPLSKLLKDFSKDYITSPSANQNYDGQVSRLNDAVAESTISPMKGFYNQLINPPDNRNTHA